MAELNEFEKSNHLKEMRDRVTLTFFERTVFDKYLKLIISATEEVQEVLRILMQERSIDNAVGKQLDIIGDIVGQPREIIDAEFVEWFGYNGWASSQPYGIEGRNDVGGTYWDGKADLFDSVILPDSEYRLFIKSKIVKNVTKATYEDMIVYLRYVFNATYVQITESFSGGEFSVTVAVAGNFTDFEAALLQNYTTQNFDKWFFPKPLGIGINFTIASPVPFIYAPDITGNGKGYSDIDGSVPGGAYSGSVL